MSVCVCGCVALIAGVGGWAGGCGVSFLGGFLPGFLSNLGDILDLFSGVVLCCSCPLRSTVFMWVVILKGRNLGLPVHCQKAFLFRDTNPFLNYFSCFYFFWQQVGWEIKYEGNKY